MSLINVSMEGATAVIFGLNPKRGAKYSATIHNRTTQTVTVLVSNFDPQGPGFGPSFKNPIGGAKTILAGAIGALMEPYAAIGLVIGIAGSSTEIIHVMESG